MNKIEGRHVTITDIKVGEIDGKLSINLTGTATDEGSMFEAMDILTETLRAEQASFTYIDTRETDREGDNESVKHPGRRIFGFSKWGATWVPTGPTPSWRNDEGPIN